MKSSWQLQIFNRSLKKRQKFEVVTSLMNSTEDKGEGILPSIKETFASNKTQGSKVSFIPSIFGKCLDIGCATGVLSYYLRHKGGYWISADIDEENLSETKSLVKENVIRIDERNLSFKDEIFDCVVVLDFLEHIEDDDALLSEIRRVLKPKGKVYISVPRIEGLLLINKLKRLIGITQEYYGHKRPGYSFAGLRDKLKKNGFEILAQRTFSKFFTEAIELVINSIYILLGKRKGEAFRREGQHISISSASEFETHKASFKLYSLLYPLLELISKLDKLLFFAPGYVLVIKARKDGN